MTKPTALVTGANKGIGREIARRLAADGFDVWIGCRDQARGATAAAELGVHMLPLDVADDQSVLAAAETLGRQIGRLDVLINNAGIAQGFGQAPSEQPVDVVKSTYEVNLFGPIRVTQAFLPLMKASTAPRIVMMSSGLGSINMAADPASEFYAINSLNYNSSKSALNAATVAFAKELAPLGFKVNAACPGYTATDLNGHSGPRTVEQAAEIAITLAKLGADGPNAGFFNEDGPLPW